MLLCQRIQERHDPDPVISCKVCKPQERSSWFLSRMGLIRWLVFGRLNRHRYPHSRTSGIPLRLSDIGLAVGTVQRLRRWMLLISEYKRTRSWWAFLMFMTDIECNHFACQIGWTTSEKSICHWGKLISCRHGSFPQLCKCSGVELEIYQAEVTDDTVVDDYTQIPAGRDYDWVT